VLGRFGFGEIWISGSGFPWITVSIYCSPLSALFLPTMLQTFFLPVTQLFVLNPKKVLVFDQNRRTVVSQRCIRLEITVHASDLIVVDASVFAHVNFSEKSVIGFDSKRVVYRNIRFVWV
jgi:hypothetical protein